jgi:hypothetical protein
LARVQDLEARRKQGNVGGGRIHEELRCLVPLPVNRGPRGAGHVNRRVHFLCPRPTPRGKRGANARAQRPRAARHRLQRNNDLNFEVDEKPPWL